jgi:hypothetical protein
MNKNVYQINHVAALKDSKKERKFEKRNSWQKQEKKVK